MTLLHYSAVDVSILIAGLYKIEGLAENTFVSLTREVKPFDFQRSTDGREGARIYRKDDGYRMEITLAQSSGSNNVLSMLYNVDILTQMGKFPIILKDFSGSTTFFGATCWIEDLPEVDFGNELSTRTWSFMCRECTFHIGGNADEHFLLQALELGVSVAPFIQRLGIL